MAHLPVKMERTLPCWITLISLFSLTHWVADWRSTQDDMSKPNANIGFSTVVIGSLQCFYLSFYSFQKVLFHPIELQEGCGQMLGCRPPRCWWGGARNFLSGPPWTGEHIWGQTEVEKSIWSVLCKSIHLIILRVSDSQGQTWGMTGPYFSNIWRATDFSSLSHNTK